MNVLTHSNAGSLATIDTPIRNSAFGVTPARLATGLIIERGISEASEAELLPLSPEMAAP